ncbi:uncharacterized protein LOC111102519 [Crassostrea virginica]
MVFDLLFTTLVISVNILISRVDLEENATTACRPLECCKGYRLGGLNRTTCLECAPGFYGPTCIFACRYPNYGGGCQSECHCLKEHCNNIIGCPDSSPDDPKIPKIFYASNINHTLLKEMFQAKSTWNSLDQKHKAMLVSICIVGTVFLILISVYMCLTKSRSAHAIISY